LLAIELLIVNLTPKTSTPACSLPSSWPGTRFRFFFIVLHSLWQEFQLQAIVQIFADLVFATAVVYATGGIDTFFNFLYPLVIIAAAILFATLLGISDGSGGLFCLVRWWSLLL